MDENLSVSTSTTGGFAAEHADRLLGRFAFEIARTIKSHSDEEVHDRS